MLGTLSTREDSYNYPRCKKTGKRYIYRGRNPCRQYRNKNRAPPFGHTQKKRYQSLSRSIKNTKKSAARPGFPQAMHTGIPLRQTAPIPPYGDFIISLP